MGVPQASCYRYILEPLPIGSPVEIKGSSEGV